ncbi:MAG: OmpA family protein [Chitinophagales bacterium]
MTRHNNSHIYSKRILISVLFLFYMGISSVKSQVNLLLNGDFEQTREAKIKMLVDQFGNKQEFELNDSSLLEAFHPHTDDVRVMSMYWNYVEDSTGPGNVLMYNALSSKDSNAYSGKVYSKIIIMNMNYLPNEYRVDNLAGKLRRPLVKGQKYKVRFYLKFFSGNHYSKSICVGFLNKMTPYSIGINKSNKEPIYRHNIEPVWCLGSVLRDSVVYNEIEFNYTGTGDEQYIYIGNLLYEKTSYWKEQNLKENFHPIKNSKKNKRTSQNINSIYAIDRISIRAIDTSSNIALKMKQQPDFEEPNSPHKLDTVHAYTYYFDFNEDKSNADISKILSYLKNDNEISSVLIIGHTDSIGTNEYNQILSKNRALFISELIKQQIEIPISIKGMAYSKMLSRENNSLNRRVEIYYTY